MLITPAAKEIFVDMMLGNTWVNKTPHLISRTGVDGYIPFSTRIHIGMHKSSTTYSSDSIETRIFIGTGDITAAPPCGLNASPTIDDI